MFLIDGKVLEQHDDWPYRDVDAAKILRDFCKKIGITPVKFHDLQGRKFFLVEIDS